MARIIHTITRFNVPATLFATLEEAYADKPAMWTFQRGEFELAQNADHGIEYWSIGAVDRLMAIFFFDGEDKAKKAYVQLQEKSEDDIATILKNAGAMR